ncbi:MAG TPA: NADP-dependent oxidoreductase, partial [Tepidisphaeraceae bacterium]|nr:NADP-dependent oxidoreductase [Tepidisphaeraceae bacterium]
MKALRLHARGGPEQLVYEEAPKPTPGCGEVRVRVFAAGITPAELTWEQTYTTADGHSRIPSIPGHDVSGVVDSVGPEVLSLEEGEEVYGLTPFSRDGSAAEFMTLPAIDLAPHPKSLDHIQAAAVPLSALTAWQALFEHGHLVAGNKVLIHGAAGGVGAYAVQLARAHGAEIIATSSARHVAFLKSLGVHTIIDYEKEPFDKVVKDVDIVIDSIGGETRDRSWQVMRQGATLITL